MLLDPRTWSLAQCSDEVLAGASEELSQDASPETHAAVVELATGIHADVDGAIAELDWLRHRLRDELRSMGLTAAAGGTHPLAVWQDTEISGAARYRQLDDSLRALARRELEGDPSPDLTGAEVLAENRFLAARDGIDALLIDADARRLIPVREMLDAVLAQCRPHALTLGCARALDRLRPLAAATGPTVSAGARRATQLSSTWSRVLHTDSSRQRGPLRPRRAL